MLRTSAPLIGALGFIIERFANMTADPNDWRMRNPLRMAEDWTSPWSGDSAPAGSQVTPVSVIRLSSDRLLAIAVPNATALCLNIARRSWDESREMRKSAKIDRTLKGQVSFPTYGHAFDFIERIFEGVVMAYTAIEAYVNECVPEDFEYETLRRSDTILEVMRRDAIERYLSLEEKLTEVLPIVLSVPSPKGKRCWQSFKKLKRSRDRVVHMKAQDRRSSGPEQPTLWHDVFKIEPPHVQAKEIISHFIEASGIRPRWYVEYPK